MTPAVIGHYDRLSDSFRQDTVIGGDLRVRKSPERAVVDETTKKSRENSPKPKLIVSKIPTKPTRLTTAFQSAPKLNSNQHGTAAASAPSKTLQIISPNVSRMISSHETTTATLTASPTVKSLIGSLSKSRSPYSNSSTINGIVQNPNEIDSSSLQARRIFLKTGNSNLSVSNFANPLTKNIKKFSKAQLLTPPASPLASSEPIVHTFTDNHCNKSGEQSSSNVDSDKTPTNCDHNFNYSNCLFNQDDVDDDHIQNVLNRTSILINNLLKSSGGNCNFASTSDSQQSSTSVKLTTLKESHDNQSSAAATCANNKDDNDTMMSLKGNKKTSCHKYSIHQDSESEDDAVPCHEAVNTNLKVTKSLDNVNRNDFKPTASPKLSYSRATLLSTKPTVETSQVNSDSPTQSPKLSADSRFVASSDGKLNGSPSSKHRPLSAASISSSASSTSTASSSNSFGAENLTHGKIPGVTYLASIESLADHSENETHASLTMCERAALEIIESEKSYVIDLGQIIRG